MIELLDQPVLPCLRCGHDHDPTKDGSCTNTPCTMTCPACNTD